MRAAISGTLAGLLVAARRHRRSPAPPPDLARAKELYDSGDQAMSEGRYARRGADFGAAYDITHDPVLFFKIGDGEREGRALRRRARSTSAAT